jgi:hypothetical protein
MTTQPDVSKRIFTFPAQVIRGRGQEEYRQLATTRGVFDEGEIAKYNPYFWPAQISNNKFDSHSTRMAVSTLRNYAMEAEEGVSFLYSHDCEEIVGHSMGGRFVGAQGDGVAHVDADFYAVPGLQLGQVQSDQIILGIETKVLRYVSVGFYGGEWICSICGYDIWDFENCRHYPGYMFKVQADGETREVLCTADVENAHLAEVSSVYKGSTPGAIITKAEHDARNGLLTPRLRTLIERRYHVTLPEKRATVPGQSSTQASTQTSTQPNTQEGIMSQQQAEPPKPGTTSTGTMANVTTQEPGGAERGVVIGAESVAAHGDFIRALLTEAGIAEGGDDLARVRLLITRAKEGAQYRTDLITEALKEGVRAKGASFNQETYRRTLEASDLETIKLMSDDWAREARERFPGKRQTRDDAQQSATTKRKLPAAAHKVG